MDSLAQGAEKRFSGFVMRTTKRTTVPAARLGEKFLRTALCPGYWDQTGRAPSRNSKPSSAAKSENLAGTTPELSRNRKVIRYSKCPYRPGINLAKAA